MSARPVLLAVDDDPGVLRALDADLRRRYAERCRVVRAASGAEALRLLDAFALRDEPVAAVVSDQRMPEVTGVDLLAQVRRRLPGTRCVLLTAYADTDVAIRAINEIRLDHYLLKPWDPPERELYPVLDDLLDAWFADWRPTAEGVRVVADRWNAEGHRLRDFLARHHVPYRWLDPERTDDARTLLDAAGGDRAALPLVLVPGQSPLWQPSIETLATAVGLGMAPAAEFYDVVVVGGGPAGLAAAVYAGSEGLSTLLVDRASPGGQAAQSSRIENYLGFPSGLSGADLARRGLAQARRFGAEVLSPVEAVRLRTDEGRYHRLELSDGREVATHAVILALGVRWRQLDLEGIEALTGRGVYYGASASEDDVLRGEEIYLVGGANSAGQAALHLAGIAKRVHLVIRSGGMHQNMSRYLADRLAAMPAVQVHADTRVTAVHGRERLEAIELTGPNGTERRETPALFVFIGAEPATQWLGDAVRRDAHGFVLTGADVGDGRARQPLETSLPGIFAAGDVRRDANRRVASAVGEGGMAVSLVHRYLREIGAHP